MKAPLDLADLRLFIAVAEELHFRRAAERLGIAQPRLSLRIRQLEESVGVRLLDRTTRSVKLTSGGQMFLERAKYALAQIDGAIAATRNAAQGRSGQLRIGFTPAAAFEVLPRIIEQFHRELPEVDIQLSYKETAGQIPDLVEGRLDFGFLRLPVNTRRLSTLILAREAVVAAIPRLHALARRPKLRLEDFADAAFIQFSQVPGVEFQDRIAAYCSRAGFRPRAVSEAADTYSVLAMVAASFGVAIVPDWVRQVRHPRIVFRALPEIPPLVDLALAWVPAAEGTAARRFIEIAQRVPRVNGRRRAPPR